MKCRWWWVLGGAGTAFIVLSIIGVIGKWQDVDAGKHFPTLDVALALGGILANVVMAVAAIAAVTTWRKQLMGQTAHALSIRCARAVLALAEAWQATLRDLKSLQSEELGPVVYRAVLARASLERNGGNLEVLSGAATDVRALEPEVLVVWGSEVMELVRLLRKQSTGLVNHIVADLRGSVADKIVNSTAEGGLIFTGEAYALQMRTAFELAERWLGYFVGRDDAKKLEVEELRAQLTALGHKVADLLEGDEAEMLDKAAREAPRLVDAFKKSQDTNEQDSEGDATENPKS